MQFVNIQRQFFVIRSFFHPFIIMKLICIHIPDDGRCIRTQLHPVSIRITVVDPVPRAVIDPVLVHHAGLCLLRYELPEISIMHFLHWTFRPPVKLPDHGDSRRRRRKSPEYDAFRFAVFSSVDMRSQILVRVKTLTCVKSVEIHNFTSFHP